MKSCDVVVYSSSTDNNKSNDCGKEIILQVIARALAGRCSERRDREGEGEDKGTVGEAGEITYVEPHPE